MAIVGHKLIGLLVSYWILTSCQSPMLTKTNIRREKHAVIQIFGPH